jgi:hypothetical protein
MRAQTFTLIVIVGATGCTVEPDESVGDIASYLKCIETHGGQVCSDDGEPPLPPDEGGCFVTGIGHIGDENGKTGAGKANEDSFGGNAMTMKNGGVRGQWQNTTHQGDLFHGQAEWLTCWKDDGIGPEVPKAIPNNAEWGGPGKWNHKAGYTFAVHAEDRAEGGSGIDVYGITIWNEDGDVVYEELETIAGGNFQIHPPNNGHPYEVADPQL